MSHILPINAQTEKKSYNAVKIQVNSPQANIPENMKNNNQNYEFNAVNIEVNEPKLGLENKQSVYSYPQAESLVTYDQAGFLPVSVPELPVLPLAYPADTESNKPVQMYKTVKTIEVIEVPKPNFTTVDAEKKDNKELSFNGLSFKASPDVVISKKSNIEPAVNIDNVISELKNPDYDKQAVQIDKIASAVFDNTKIADAQPYLTTVVFNSLSDIVSKDTSHLAKPDEKQIETRKKIILDALIKEKQLQENPNLKIEDINTGIEITKEDLEIASVLSPFEMAERNKEYAMYTLAGLIKLYTEEYRKNVGDTVPFTDLPGVTSIVDSLKNEENPNLKIAAINSLALITKPEYLQEISSILKVAAKDKNPAIAQYASMALKAAEKQN